MSFISNCFQEKREISLSVWFLPMLINVWGRVGDAAKDLGIVAEGREEYKK